HLTARSGSARRCPHAGPPEVARGRASPPSFATDDGRTSAARKVVEDEFNCLSGWSDATPEQCTALRFLKVGTHEQERQFKVPSLRNVADRGPYMDAGQFAILREVLEHYDAAPAAPAGHSELKPLHLSE